jgi:hypothetical protein
MTDSGASPNLAKTQQHQQSVAGACRRLVGGLARGLAPPAQVIRSRKLRIGFEVARPWCFYAQDELRGEEIEACRTLARLLGASPVFYQLPREELVAQLLRGELDIGVGGLVEQGYEGIRCIEVRTITRVETFSRYRKIFFPTVWWIRRGSLGWQMLLYFFLSVRRVTFRLREDSL